MFYSANEVINEIEQRKNRGYGFGHFQNYMKTLQDPQNQLRCIHVAGTNGKGSTTNDIRSMLQEAGYRVGSFTSPYIENHRDRIRINDVYIDETTFLDICNAYYDSWMEWDLSMFEIDMCIAVLYFIQEKVDYAVFEVGLGGRKDFTNIIHPLVSVITNIGMDHMELLGDTYEKIAEEKAGIIKDDVDLVTGEDKAECLAVFDRHVKQAHSTCHRVLPAENVRIKQNVSFDYRHLKNIQLASDAAYQVKNASCAIETILYLREHHMADVDDDAILRGLQKAIWIGRFETIQEHPRVILDGAHNAHGIQALVQSLQGMKDIRVIFSVLKDKNFEEMLDVLEAISDDITVCAFANARALDIQVLAHRDHITLCEDWKSCVDQAIHGDKTVVITGSLYFISEVRKYLLGDK